MKISPECVVIIKKLLRQNYNVSLVAAIVNVGEVDLEEQILKVRKCTRCSNRYKIKKHKYILCPSCCRKEPKENIDQFFSRPWTKPELRRLKKEFEQDLPLSEIAKLHSRTKRAIQNAIAIHLFPSPETADASKSPSKKPPCRISIFERGASDTQKGL